MKAGTFGPALKTIAVLLLIAGIGGGYVLLQNRRSGGARRDSAVHGSAGASAKPIDREAPKPESAPKAQSAGKAAAKPPEQSNGKPLEEPALMAKLRELTARDPESALRLAREANERFPNSQDAAERAWIVVKSLDNLKRFHEGQAEARIMVERYRGTSWAADVERHTLVYPLDQPSREEMQARERERSQPH
jgi:hypothetical protein